jgi:serine phosphatase RsbU (regulator of sigma subunit)
LKDNFMRYAGAGHPPLLLTRASSEKAVKVLENGLILGIFTEATYEALQLPLEPCDRIVLCTDGIPEAPNRVQEQDGTDRIMRFMEDNTSLRADQFSDALLREVSLWSEQFPEQGQQDDITLLVIGSAR